MAKISSLYIIVAGQLPTAHGIVAEISGRLALSSIILPLLLFAIIITSVTRVKLLQIAQAIVNQLVLLALQPVNVINHPAFQVFAPLPAHPTATVRAEKFALQVLV